MEGLDDLKNTVEISLWSNFPSASKGYFPHDLATSLTSKLVISITEEEKHEESWLS